jgi:hypothetical protein
MIHTVVPTQYSYYIYKMYFSWFYFRDVIILVRNAELQNFRTLLILSLQTYIQDMLHETSNYNINEYKILPKLRYVYYIIYNGFENSLTNLQTFVSNCTWHIDSIPFILYTSLGYYQNMAVCIYSSTDLYQYIYKWINNETHHQCHHYKIYRVFFPRSRVHGFYAWVIDRHNICCLDPTKPVTKKDVGI